MRESTEQGGLFVCLFACLFFVFGCFGAPGLFLTMCERLVVTKKRLAQTIQAAGSEETRGELEAC